ncbi:MAG: molybdopterin molybdotransferase MoeA [Firmicutes bacterium]|nr:molybdopterin molybdotransferase MoeA [Bacillota bacterium]
MKLLKVDTLEMGIEKLHKAYVASGATPKTELVPLVQSFGKVLAEDVYSSEVIPGFNRSVVDGYAVKSIETAGSSDSMPVFLEVVGEVEMGKAAPCQLESGQCMYVPTGGMIPVGADAVAMVEHCQPFGLNQMAVYSPLSYGKNMVFAGDDVAEGQAVLAKGKKISPADMGLLASLGKTEVLVYKPWKVYIISTGDEIVEPNKVPAEGQVRDVNTYGLIGEVQKLGFEVCGFELIKDDYELLKTRAEAAKETCDIVLISGGSSKGKKDATAQVIEDITGEVLTHGLSVKPGKPTIIAHDKDSQTIYIGLPGHPVAALLLFRLVVGGLWKALTGMDKVSSRNSLKARIAFNLAAAPGRKTFQLVKLDGEGATPILGKSGLIRTMSEADGYIILDVNNEGINKGEEVEVYLL